MAPKKKDEVPQAIPEVEEEVVLPEGVEAPPETSFCLALGHLFGHSFLVQPKQDDDAEDGQPAAPISFDPKAVLLERAKAPPTTQEELLSRKVMVVDREELQALAKTPEGEEKPLSWALRARLEKERVARGRAKSNAARRKAIAAAEAAKTEEAAEEGAGCEADAGEQQPQVDFLLLTSDYPSNADELRELAEAGLCSQDVVDVWATVYLAGESVETDENGIPREVDDLADDLPTMSVPTPAMVLDFYNAIQAAKPGTELSGCTICTVRDSNAFAFPPEGVGQAEHVQDAVLTSLGLEAASRRQFKAWLGAATKVSLPVGPSEKGGEARLYHRMMSSVDASHHDVPLFLHCLTEQVERTLGGEAQKHEDDVAMSSLMEYLGAACDGVISDGRGSLPAASKTARTWHRTGDQQQSQQLSQQASRAISDEAAVLPYLDRSMRAHHLGSGGGAADIGGEPVLSAVRRVLDEVRATGVKRNGLPKDSLHSQAQREALAHRLYPFAPEVSAAEMEQLLLTHAFEELVCKAQPERRGKWCFLERSFRERIPRDLVAQTLQAALSGDPFVSTVHVPRHDALLVALHYRSPGGRVMWNAWRGDLFADVGAEKWQESLFTTPTYNDWAQVFGGRSGEAPQPRFLMEGLDAREFGYGGMFEKLATPPDGSVILVTRSEMGLSCSFPVPSNDLLWGPEQEAVDRAERKSALDDAASSVPTQIVHGGPQAAEAKLRAARAEVPAAKVSRVARVMKDGLTFGIVRDRAFEDWRQAEAQRRRAEAAEVRVAARSEAAAEDAEGAGGQGSGEEAADLALPPSPFDDLTLGSLWLALPGGARVSARMHHERVLLAPSPGVASLYSSGVLLTYTMAAGQVIQVFGDGAVCLTFPLELSEGAAASKEAAANGVEGEAPSKPKLKSHFAPGCPEDLEVSRTVTPSGCLCRRLLSGRAEVYQDDGTVSFRNPTPAELRNSLEDARNRPGGSARHAVEVLERLVKVYKEQELGPLREPPSEEQKVAGLPGHWVVVRQDGRSFGRAPPLQEPMVAEAHLVEPGAAEGEGAQGEAAAGDAHPGSGLEPAVEALPPLQELLVGSLIEGGSIFEYEIVGVPAAYQADLETGHWAVTNAQGLSSFGDPKGIQKICFHADGTQITRTCNEAGGYDVVISKEPFAYARCEVDGTGQQRTIIKCADGAELEVFPQAGGQDVIAQAKLSCRGGVTVLSSGLGDVEVFTRPGSAEEQGGVYRALVHEGRLLLTGAQSDESVEGAFELKADQTLTVPRPTDISEGEELSSPRCAASAVGYRWPNTEFSAPKVAPPPRLFVIYGDGEAEELLEAPEARRLLEEAAEDELASIVEGPDMGECKAHTLFRKRLPDAPVVAPVGYLAVPEGFDGGGSSCYSVLEAASKENSVQVSAAPVVEWRHFVEYPVLSEEMREKFRGTLRQYREWEAAQLSKTRFAMQGPDAGKGKKDAKGVKDKAKDKGKADKKSKKGKKGAVFEVEEEVEKPPEPAFVQDFKISAFEHHLQVLRGRAAKAKRPDGEERLKHALEQRIAKAAAATSRELEGSGDAEGTATYTIKVTGIDYEALACMPTLLGAVREAVKTAFAAEAGHGVGREHIDIAFSAGSLVVEATIATPEGVAPASVWQQLAGSPRLGQAVAEAVAGVVGIEQVAIGPIGVSSGAVGEDGMALSDGLPADLGAFGGAPSDAGAASPTGRSEAGFAMDETQQSFGMATPEAAKSSRRQPDAEFSFAYFKSEMGLQFLMETGELDMERKVKQKRDGNVGEQRQGPTAARSPWNPALVGEEPVQETTQREQEGRRSSRSQHMQDEEQRQGYYYLDEQPEHQEYKLPFHQQQQRGVPQERVPTPDGPHPDKKSSKWDHRGDLRPPKPPVSQAYVEINTDYLEVEGATDRRVRTSSIAHKKNAQRAPSVQSVRKTGAHAVGRGTELSAKEIVGDIRDVGHEEHWKLTSTMQGLGDSNNLVAVVPGTCRFGPLCLGKVYRMYFFLRNLDVDTTGYVITSHSDFVQICHTPGEIVGDGSKVAGKIAPGMAKKVCVEIAAHTPKDRIEHLIEIMVKAHKISVPVTARILDVEEYEKDDATEMAIHQRHIGRTRERGDPASNGKPPPVEEVPDPEYCKQAFSTISRRLHRNGTVQLPPIQQGGGYPR